MDVQFYQQLSLYISIFTVIAMSLLGVFRKKARLFYLSMIAGWIPGIVYYISVLYFYNDFLLAFKVPATEVSAILRTYQYFMFGGWFIFDSLYTLAEYLKIRKTKKKLARVISKLKKASESEKDE